MHFWRKHVAASASLANGDCVSAGFQLGVGALDEDIYRTIEQMIRALDRTVLKEKLVRRGDLVVVLAGSPVGVSGTTNLMEIHRVGRARREGATRRPRK